MVIRLAAQRGGPLHLLLEPVILLAVRRADKQSL
jgi:hypothetical protein